MPNIETNVVPVRDPMVHDLHIRVSRIEENEQSRNTQMAVMENDMSYVKEAVGGITKGINRILWAIGLSVLAAISTFILSGGLVVVQQ